MNIGFAQIRGYTLSAPHPPPPVGRGDNLQCQILKRGESEKNKCLGGGVLKSPYQRYLPGGLTMLLVRKTINQLFSFVTFC